jgi:thiol-disulfide isomerase/thioredoxin
MPRSKSGLVHRFVAILTVLLLIATSTPASAQEAAPEVDAKNPFPNRVKAAELDGGVEWLNTSGPIGLRDLRGKVVLLDFWTFCCINCMHVLPDLEFLEKKYGNELVVIGVHSAKFDNEKESGNIRKAILRYEIEHPVINDAEMTVWRKYGVRSWPTLVLIDPEGYYCGFISGEGNRELLDNVIGGLAAYHKAKGTLDETPVRFDLERNRAPATPLKFPGKVLADPAGDRLFISDSNHNRIIVAGLDGRLQDVIGNGLIGRTDGSYSQAQFDHPQGMALIGKTLYVADTENHLLRTIDLESKTVSTLAGTGQQASFRAGGGPLLETALNSPWDVLPIDGVLYIAMAGPHQIWSHKLGSQSIQPYAGSGKEDITDGPLAESALAQPSGLATDGTFLYVCDSEGSSIRRISTRSSNNLNRPDGAVTTVAGTSDLPNGRSLFEFGDIDGPATKARLQHPLGIAYHNGDLLVADSYNHKIRLIQLKGKRVETWLGTGKAGNGLAPVQFAEPAGLSIAGDKLYVADTNNHRIVLVDLKSKAASELTIAGLTPPAPPAGEVPASMPREELQVEEQSVKSASALTIDVAFQLPEGYKLNKLAPVSYRLTVDDGQQLIADDNLNARTEAKAGDAAATIEIPLAARVGTAVLHLAVTYPFCRDGVGGLCKIDTAYYHIPVNVGTAGTADRIKLTAAPRK